MKTTNYDRVFGYSVASIHELYVAKVERKGHTREEVDQVICWLTGHSEASLAAAMDEGQTLGNFFDKAPAMNPARELIKGVICGVRVEEIEDGTMQNIRYMDKLVDEVANGKAMAKILRSA